MQIVVSKEMSAIFYIITHRPRHLPYCGLAKPWHPPLDPLHPPGSQGNKEDRELQRGFRGKA